MSSRLKNGTKVMATSIPGMDGECEGEIVGWIENGYAVKITGNFYSGSNAATKKDTRTVRMEPQFVHAIKGLRSLAGLSEKERQRFAKKYQREYMEAFQDALQITGNQQEQFRNDFMKRNNLSL
jgi:hypothetical protein